MGKVNESINATFANNANQIIREYQMGIIHSETALSHLILARDKRDAQIAVLETEKAPTDK